MDPSHSPVSAFPCYRTWNVIKVKSHIFCICSRSNSILLHSTVCCNGDKAFQAPGFALRLPLFLSFVSHRHFLGIQISDMYIVKNYPSGIVIALTRSSSSFIKTDMYLMVNSLAILVSEQLRLLRQFCFASPCKNIQLNRCALYL